MKIGIMDADMVYRKRHRFPNLTCMKLSGYHKALGNGMAQPCADFIISKVVEAFEKADS